jgi:hypothetical protein
MGAGLDLINSRMGEKLPSNWIPEPLKLRCGSQPDSRFFRSEEAAEKYPSIFMPGIWKKVFLYALSPLRGIMVLPRFLTLKR